MKFQLLPSTIENGRVSNKQHLSCFIIDDRVAIDAGSLAMSSNDIQKKQIRDVVLTHAHIDHIAGLPLFIDDLFARITNPIKIYATEEIIKILRDNIFNWKVYPNFAELENENGIVLEYCPFEPEKPFRAGHLEIKALNVNHKVPAVGFIVSDNKSKFAITGDTAEMDGFWDFVNAEKSLDALFIECAFPNEFVELAEVSHHITPQKLFSELKKFRHIDCPVYAINLKPLHRETIVSEILDLRLDKLEILEVDKIYNI